MQRKYRTRRIISTLLMASYLLLVMGVNAVYGQLVDNFDDGELANPRWQGDINNFTVNQGNQLQLMAAVAGTSKIYTKYKKPKDSISIQFYNKMQFAPSADNNQIIYLMMDKPDETTGSGYYISIGENGSNDALKFYRVIDGTSVLLGTGSLGAMGIDPADVRLNIRISFDGTWDISSDYSGGTSFSEDAMFVDNISWLPDSLYFGMNAKYTVSRIDKFFLDDIKITTIEKDVTPPSLTGLKLIPPASIQLDFSEALDASSTQNISNYDLQPGIGSPQSATLSGTQSVILKFVANLNSGVQYMINFNGIKDKFGNAGQGAGNLIFAEAPAKGDLILTEVLTDPSIGGEDFVEIYNRSSKFIQLKGLTIKNISKNESKTLVGEYELAPTAYVAISKNVSFLRDKYEPVEGASFIEEALPSLNVSDAYVGILMDGILIDSFSYNVEQHFGLLDETKGVSMERINLKGPSNDVNNWHSAASTVNYATPGYQNSNNFISKATPESVITFDKEVITPNGDGQVDFAYIRFQLPKPGFLATMHVYNTEGLKLFSLGDNLLVPTEGVIKFDGLNPNGERLRMGMYIIGTRFFHPDGDVIESKNVISVADTK